MSDFVQRNIDQDPVVVLNDISNKVFDAFDGKPWFTVDPEDKRKDLKQKYNRTAESILDFYSYITHPKIETYLLANDYLQRYAGEAVEFLANLSWLNGDHNQLFKVLTEDFLAIDKKYKLLNSVVNIDYYYHEISRYAHNGDLDKAIRLYEALTSIRNYSGLYIVKKDLKTLPDLEELWYFNE